MKLPFSRSIPKSEFLEHPYVKSILMNRFICPLVFIFAFMTIACGKDYKADFIDTNSMKNTSADSTSSNPEKTEDIEGKKVELDTDITDYNEDSDNEVIDGDIDSIYNDSTFVRNDSIKESTQITTDSIYGNNSNVNVQDTIDTNTELYNNQADEFKNDFDPYGYIDNEDFFSNDNPYKYPLFNNDSEFKMTKFMDLSNESGLSSQGSACYEDYFIQGYATNSCITIYNLPKKEKLCTIEIPSPYANHKIHVNTICFGQQRYELDDFFPILYVCSGYVIGEGNKIYAYRIKKNSNSFELEHLQTIILKDFGSWTEGIFDTKHCYFWIKYEKNGSRGMYGYAKYKVPDIKANKIIINYSEYLEDFKLPAEPYPSSNQGHQLYGGRIILASGTNPKTQTLAFISINTETQERDLIIDLCELGIESEPEGVIRYNNKIMICYKNSIYLLESR